MESMYISDHLRFSFPCAFAFQACHSGNIKLDTNSLCIRNCVVALTILQSSDLIQSYFIRQLLDKKKRTVFCYSHMMNELHDHAIHICHSLIQSSSIQIKQVLKYRREIMASLWHPRSNQNADPASIEIQYINKQTNKSVFRRNFRFTPACDRLKFCHIGQYYAVPSYLFENLATLANSAFLQMTLF